MIPRMKPSFLITDTNSIVLYASPGCRDRAGFDIPEMIGRKPGELWGGLMPKNYYEHFWSHIIRKKPYIGRVENRKKDGKRFLDEVHIAAMTNEKDQIQYFIEMHPASKSKQEQEAFDENFADLGNGADGPAGIIRLLNKYMQEDIQTRIHSRQALIRYLEQKYIATVQATYQSRKDDRELILEAQQNAEAFAELYQKYLFQVRAFFSHRVNQEGLAEDFTHETFERAFRALPSFAPSNASYLTYLLRIAHNLLVSHYRKSSQVIDGRPAARHTIEVMEKRDAIERGLEQLNPGDRQVIQMKYGEGQRIKEIAECLDRSENAIKLQLSRARKKLRKIIFTGEKGG